MTARAVSAVGWAVFVAVLGVFLVLALRGDGVPDDLEVYRGAAVSALEGKGLYSFARPNGDAFTYPPAAGLLLLWTGLGASAVITVAWFVLTGVLLVLSARALSKVSPVPAGVLAALLVLSSPGRSNLEFGQFSVVVFALCVLAIGGVSDRRAGALFGVAAATKLTPAVFVPFLVVMGRWRQAALTALVGLAVTVGAAVLWPGASREYWGAAGVGQRGVELGVDR